MPETVTLNQLVLLCRAGFEKECAGEILKLAAENAFSGYAQTDENSAVVRIIGTDPSQPQALLQLVSEIDFHALIFARQWFVSSKHVMTLPEHDRIPDILNEAGKLRESLDIDQFNAIELDYADTNEGKSLNRFCNRFHPHLVDAFNQKRWLSRNASWRLHCYFTDSRHVIIGCAPVINSAPVAMGIPRLKMPASAPSRSTLKLDEAILWFLEDRPGASTTTGPARVVFKPGQTAVDLGAAPGGWTWQLVRRGCKVTAIDNGPLQDELMKTGMVEHLRTDAFTFAPDKKVDWLVCDMAERPLHVSRLISRWFVHGLCRHAIFNLKLPMKKRLQTVHDCLLYIDQALQQAGIQYELQAKHLYHDREEITVCITTA